jgi:hypothetical protein
MLPTVGQLRLFVLVSLCLLRVNARGPASINGVYFPSTCASRCTAESNYQQPVPNVPNPNKATRASQWTDLLLVLVSCN